MESRQGRARDCHTLHQERSPLCQNFFIIDWSYHILHLQKVATVAQPRYIKKALYIHTICAAQRRRNVHSVLKDNLPWNKCIGHRISGAWFYQPALTLPLPFGPGYGHWRLDNETGGVSTSSPIQTKTRRGDRTGGVGVSLPQRCPLHQFNRIPGVGSCRWTQLVVPCLF